MIPYSYHPEAEAEFADAARFHESRAASDSASASRALALEPTILVADEPVSALDVSQVLRLLADIRDRFNLTMLFITHDLRVAAQVRDSIAVMRNGEIVAYGATASVYADPQHAYTRELLEPVPGRHWQSPVGAAFA